MRPLLIAILCIATVKSSAQEILSDSGALLFRLQNSQIVDARNVVVYTIGGNMVFEGASRDNEEILYLVRSRDIFSKEVGQVFNPDLSKTLFSMYRGRLYLGNELGVESLLLEVKTGNEEIVVLDYLGAIRGRWLLTSQPMTNMELVAVMIALVQRHGVEALLMGAEPKVQEIATIKPYISDIYYTGYDEWTWDGHILKPRYGVRPQHEWTFDGRFLRPVWANGFEEEWEWNGETLQPAWPHPEGRVYTWDGRTFRPMWLRSLDDEWVIEWDRAKPKYGNDLRREWTIEGEIPVPVVALVILGYAYR
jgi:hypothetical protein